MRGTFCCAGSAGATRFAYARFAYALYLGGSYLPRVIDFVFCVSPTIPTAPSARFAYDITCFLFSVCMLFPLTKTQGITLNQGSFHRWAHENQKPCQRQRVVCSPPVAGVCCSVTRRAPSILLVLEFTLAFYSAYLLLHLLNMWILHTCVVV